MNPLLKKFTIIGTAIITLSGLGLVVKTWGFWPASAASVADNAARIDTIELKSYYQQLWDVQDRIDTLQRSGKRVPQDLWTRKSDLEAWIRQLGGSG